MFRLMKNENENERMLIGRNTSDKNFDIAVTYPHFQLVCVTQLGSNSLVLIGYILLLTDTTPPD